MKIFENSVSEGQFILKDITYNVTQTSLAANYQDMELVLFPEVAAKAENNRVEYSMSYVRLYHNNGFNTHTSCFDGLKGKKFIWSNEYNAENEEAGTLYVQEHEAVRKGTIEILNVESGQLTIKWDGKADVGWSRKYGSNVPFNTIFTVKIPDAVSYCLDAFKSPKMKIDEETVLEIVNLEEFNQEVRRVSETRIWDSFNTTLRFKLICANAEYPGEVLFTNGKNKIQLTMDKDCPRRIQFIGVDYNLRMKYEMFRFEVAGSAT